MKLKIKKKTLETYETVFSNFTNAYQQMKELRTQFIKLNNTAKTLAAKWGSSIRYIIKRASRPKFFLTNLVILTKLKQTKIFLGLMFFLRTEQILNTQILLNTSDDQLHVATMEGGPVKGSIRHCMIDQLHQSEQFLTLFQNVSCSCIVGCIATHNALICALKNNIENKYGLCSVLKKWVIVHFNYFWNFRVFSG
jgi:hypothetical protein